MWSPKQQRVIDAINNPQVRQIIVPGPVQSGKTYSAAMGFFLWAATHHTGEDFLLCSSSRKQMQGTLFKYAQEFADMTGVGWRRREDYYQMRSAKGGNNRFFPLTGMIRGSEAKARSFSVMGVFRDERTLLDEDFCNSTSDRASRPGAIELDVCNPSGPLHPLKTDHIDKADGETVVHIPFALADNPTLEPHYVKRLHERYTGAQYKRMVLGEWAATHGAIFPNFAESVVQPPDVREAWKWTMGVDWAHSSVTHCVLSAHFKDGTACVVDEWYHDAEADGPMDEADQARLIKRWVADRPVRRVAIDPKAIGMWQALRRELDCPILLADNEVGAGIQFLRTRMEAGAIMVSRKCVNLVRQASNYAWDDQAGLLGVDRPIKKDDHGVDAWRYDEWTGGGPRRKVRVLRTAHHVRRYG